LENRSSEILQWDLNEAAIASSTFQIVEGTDYLGALQLASNNKIYAAVYGQNYLAVINTPEEKGNASNFSTASDQGALSLDTQSGTLGLPPFIQSFFEKKIGIIEPDDIAISNLELCEGDSYTLRSEAFPEATYTWYWNTNQLPNTAHFLEVNKAGDYQVVIELNDGSCQLRGIANVTIHPLPMSRDASLIQCTVPGVTSLFDLTESISVITNKSNDLTALFFNTFTDAASNTNPIPTNAYESISNTELLYVRVEHSTTKCYRIQKLTLILNRNTAKAYQLETCDAEDTDGLADFDLSEITTHLQQDNATITPSITYYKTAEDALLQQHTLANPNIINTVPYMDSYYARVEDSANNCIGIHEIQLLVHPLPKLQPDRSIDYCIDNEEPFTLNAGILEMDSALYTFLWSPTGENTYKISSQNPVTHTVTVSQVATGCSSTRTLHINTSEKATITNISIEGYSRNTATTITVKGIGDYEYAIDAPEGPYQDSNNFNNLDIGIHEVYIRDKNNCGIAGPHEFPVLGFPEFFTPNNDGFHDYWQVEGLLEIDQLQANIYIFDRYGKLLKTIQGSGQGWDGTLHGKLMLPDDYWVKVALSNGLILSSHFSLIR